MADDKKTPREDETTADDAPTAEPAAAATEPEAAEGEPTSDEELADMKSRLLHTLADMENLRRRTEREIADAHKYAVSNFAREMLTVSDNLRRALEAVPEELRSGEDKAATALIEGVEVTERSLEQTLQKFGVARIEAKGKKFDPSMHQAMMQVDDEAGEPGTVADEIQVGYAIGDRVLRPAFVSVVKKRKAVTPAADNDAMPPADDAVAAKNDED
ncbi:MAG: nucleotide exchange factor GrpE [Alphaproteobacteria bacterium]